MKSFICRGIVFRRHNDQFGSTHSGNFIMSLELIAEFDTFLTNYISKCWSTSYLYLSIYEKFIGTISEKVKKLLIMK